MKRISRRPSSAGVSVSPAGLAALPGEGRLDGKSRRAFLQGGAGAAAGTALILATPKVASVALEGKGSSGLGGPKATVTNPSGLPPREPVTAYVRDPARGEVTVMSGKQEITYRDQALVERLLDAAGR